MLRRLLLLGILLLAPVSIALAQEARLLLAEDEAYMYLRRLQQRGALGGLQPSTLPYTFGEIESALALEDVDAMDPVEQRWVKLVLDRISAPLTDSTNLGITVILGGRAAQNSRLDPLRHLEGNRPVYPGGIGAIWAADDRFVAEMGMTLDYFYVRDPDGIVDPVKTPWLRTENSYLGYTKGIFDLHLGRYSEHWGLAGRPGLFLSKNPHSFDRIRMQIGGSRLRLSGSLGELDSITGDGRFTGYAGDDSVATGSERRYLASHRLDWRPIPNLVISLFESVLYSGAGVGVSLKYLNPMHALFELNDRMPKNEENNAFVGLGIWSQFGRTTIEWQLLIDDVDFLALKTGQKPSSNSGGRSEPALLSFTSSITQAAVRPTLDLGMDFTAVTSRAYIPLQTEGRFVYLNRGIGTQNIDFVEGTLRGSWYADRVTPGLILEPYLTLLWQGERDFRKPYSGSEDFRWILSGTVERTVRTAVRMTYHPISWLFVRVDAGYNQTENDGFVQDRNRNRLLIQGAFHIRMTLDSGFSWKL